MLKKILKLIKKLFGRILKMLKIGSTEIETSNTITKDSTDVATVRAGETTVWEKATGNPNPVWSGDSLLHYNSDTPIFGLWRSQDFKGIGVSCYHAEPTNFLNYTPEGFTGQTSTTWVNTEFGFYENTFTLKPDALNKYKIIAEIDYNVYNPHYDFGILSCTLEYNPVTKKFSGQIVAGFPSADNAMSIEVLIIRSTDDGGIKVIYGVSYEGEIIHYYEQTGEHDNTIYLR
jgi:hypothetical protein